MTIRHLKVFISVVENGGITRAAEVLHVAQPAVSQTIADIEKYYNVVLFNRVNNKITLTENGKRLFLKALETVASFNDFESVALSALKSPTVRIGSSASFAETSLAAFVGRVKKKYPDVTVFCRADDEGEIKNGIVGGEFDFGIVGERGKDDQFLSFPLSAERLIAVRGKDFPCADQLTLRGLLSLPLCVRERGSSSRELLEKEAGAAGGFLRPVLESRSNGAILAFVKEGLGAAVLPEACVREGISDGTLCQIGTEGVSLTLQSYAVRHKTKKFTRAQALVFDLFTEGAGEGGEK